MGNKWTTNQEKALKQSGNNILVSAAAGSRKNCCISRTHYQ